MQQYFGNKKEDKVIYLKNEDSNHIKNVMRYKENDQIYVVFDSIKYLCFINNDLSSVTIIDKVEESASSNKIIAYIPILQEEKMSFVIQKGTELGVSEFIPIYMERCKYKLDEKGKQKKIERWNKVIKSACEQSHRLDIPVITNIILLDTIELNKGVNILCSTDKSNVKLLREVLNSNSMCDTINLVYGPEGGISPKEEEYLESVGFIKTTLGHNILRTETVLIYLLSVINYLRGE